MKIEIRVPEHETERNETLKDSYHAPRPGQEQIVGEERRSEILDLEFIPRRGDRPAGCRIAEHKMTARRHNDIHQSTVQNIRRGR